MKKLIGLIVTIFNIFIVFSQNENTEKQFIILLNNYRDSNNLTTFKSCEYMQKTAEIQCQYLANDLLHISHKNSNEGMTTVFDRFMSTNPDYVPLIGECVTVCDLNAENIIKKWKNSKLHNEILLSDTYMGTIGIKILKVKGGTHYIAVLVLG